MLAVEMATPLDTNGSITAVQDNSNTTEPETDSKVVNSRAYSPGNDPPPPVNPVDKSWFSVLPSWKPTSEESLLEAERRVLSSLTTDYTDHFVPVAENVYVRTVSMEPQQPPADPINPKHPLVMVHGFGCGLGCFYKNLDHLHSNRHLYAFDVLGFGRSTRAPFSDDPETVENQFVDSIEKWRQAMGIERMILLGHSLGAFMSTAYAMKYPDRVRHLILVDAWGFLEHPEQLDTRRIGRLRFIVPVVQAYFKVFNPFSMVRALGPIGPTAISKFRRDLQEKFGEEFMSYVYHCNAQVPSGENGFFHMQLDLTFAKRPMLNRLDDLPSSMPVSMMIGTKSWFDTTLGKKVYEQRSQCFVDVHYVEDAGHHIHADLPDAFNRVVNGICELVDNNGDTMGDGEMRDENIAFHTHKS